MPIRFKINIEKCIQGIDFLAHRKPGITQYYIGKTFFFADKEHLLDWGRPISGDRFIAMEHGPVPSCIYDLLKDTSAEPDEIIDMLNERIELVHSDNKIKVYSKGKNNYPHLSGSEIEYLERSLDKYSNLSFSKLKAISHEDPAYMEAWGRQCNSEMDISLWFSGKEWNEISAIQQLEETARLSYHTIN